MIKTIELTLSAPTQRLVPSIGSTLQGVLMELVDENLATALHQPGLRPYSQYCCYRDNELIWRLTALNSTAVETILKPLLADDFCQITLKQKNLTLSISKKTVVEELSYRQFADRFFLADNPARKILLNFITPTGFRSANNYLIYPNIEHILQNLYLRYNSFAGQFSLADPDLLPQMNSYVSIKDYHLSMARFSLERVTIPAFHGNLLLSCKGPDALVRIINLFLAYSAFAGIGIKTAIGMGGTTVRPLPSKTINERS